MATTWSQWATQQQQAQTVNMGYQQRTWAPQQPTYTRHATTYATQQEMEMMTPDQITQRAVAVHTDTTQGLRRCVATAHQSVAIAAGITVQLQEDREKLQHIHVDCIKIDDRLRTSDATLKDIGRSFIPSFILPKHKKKKSQMQALHEQQQQDSSSTRSNLKELRRKLFGRSDKDQQQQGSSAAGSSMGPVGPDTSGLAQAGYGTAAAQIDEQTAQQEQLWGELSCAVDGLKARAVAIREELSVQNQQLDTMCGNAGVLQASMGGAQARLNRLKK